MLSLPLEVVTSAELAFLVCNVEATAMPRVALL